MCFAGGPGCSEHRKGIKMLSVLPCLLSPRPHAPTHAHCTPAALGCSRTLLGHHTALNTSDTSPCTWVHTDVYPAHSVRWLLYTHISKSRCSAWGSRALCLPLQTHHGFYSSPPSFVFLATGLYHMAVQNPSHPQSMHLLLTHSCHIDTHPDTTLPSKPQLTFILYLNLCLYLFLCLSVHTHTLFPYF